MSKYSLERPRHVAEIDGVNEQSRVSDLPAAAAAHEAPKLLLGGPSLPRRLLLEGAERSEVSLRVDDLFHGGGTEGADQRSQCADAFGRKGVRRVYAVEVSVLAAGFR
jgi:hypothetical protein